MVRPHIMYVIFICCESPIDKECAHLGRGTQGSEEPPKYFLISFSCKIKLPYSVNFKLIQKFTQSQAIIFAFWPIVIMYNTTVSKLILLPVVKSSFALRACGFNIIRKPDINSVLTLSVAIRARGK